MYVWSTWVYINLIEKRKQPAPASQIFSFCLFQNFTQVRFTQVPPSYYCIIFCSKSTTQSPWKSVRDCEIRLIRSYNSLRMPRFLRYFAILPTVQIVEYCLVRLVPTYFCRQQSTSDRLLKHIPHFPPVTRFEDLHDADACR